MKVLFVQDIQGTAYAGDIKEVKPGFARNYLLPRKLAVLATKDQMNRVEGLRTAANKRRNATETDMNALAERMEGMTIVIEGRAGRNDRLYGAVTNVLVAEHLTETLGREIDRRRIILQPIRQLGIYQVPVKLYTGIEPKVTVIVTAPGRPLPGQEDAEAADEIEAGAVEEQPEATGQEVASAEEDDADAEEDDAGVETPAAGEEPSAEVEAAEVTGTEDGEPREEA